MFTGYKCYKHYDSQTLATLASPSCLIICQLHASLNIGLYYYMYMYIYIDTWLNFAHLSVVSLSMLTNYGISSEC